MSYLGIDTSKDFTVNGMKYSKNKDGWYESEANSDAQAAYEQLKANNRIYQFADEKTKKQIAYISDYLHQKPLLHAPNRKHMTSINTDSLPFRNINRIILSAK